MEDQQDRSISKDLDKWVEQLNDCKQLTETQVKTLTDKVSYFSCYSYVNKMGSILYFNWFGR